MSYGRFVWTIAGLIAAVAALRSAGAEAAEPVPISLDAMTLGGPPIGFAPRLTGSGGPVMWQIRPDITAPGGKVIGQVSQERVDNRFPVLLYNAVRLRDVDVSVRFKPISGFVDRAAGIIVRARDANNYYVVRANALENRSGSTTSCCSKRAMRRFPTPAASVCGPRPTASRCSRA